MSKPGRHQHTFTDQETSAIEFVPLARLEAAEARARKATEALDALWSDLGEMGQHHTPQAVTAEVLSALATIREGS